MLVARDVGPPFSTVGNVLASNCGISTDGIFNLDSKDWALSAIEDGIPYIGFGRLAVLLINIELHNKYNILELQS